MRAFCGADVGSESLPAEYLGPRESLGPKDSQFVHTCRRAGFLSGPGGFSGFHAEFRRPSRPARSLGGSFFTSKVDPGQAAGRCQKRFDSPGRSAADSRGLAVIDPARVFFQQPLFEGEHACES